MCPANPAATALKRAEINDPDSRKQDTRKMRATFLVSFVTLVSCSADIEWAGVFDSPGVKTIAFRMVNGRYADPSIKVVAMQTTDIVASETVALEQIRGSCVTVHAGGSFGEGACYELMFEKTANVTTFDCTVQGAVALFTNHHALEFETQVTDVDVIQPQATKQYASYHSHGDAHEHSAVADDHTHDPEDHTHDVAIVSFTLAVVGAALGVLNLFVLLAVAILRCSNRRAFATSLIGLELTDAS